MYTNGTLVDGELLTDEQAGHCVSINESAVEDDAPKSDAERKFGICILDCSTSEFNLSCFEDDICRTKLETLMRQIRPKEIVYKKVGIILAILVNVLDISSTECSFHQHPSITEEYLTLELPLDFPPGCGGIRLRKHIGGTEDNISRYTRR